jgi:hypothetical protein
MKIVALILVLALVGCSHSYLGKGLNIGVGLAKVADQVSTDAAERRGAIEGNPLLGSDQWRQVLGSALGIGAVVVISGVVEKRGHRITSHVIRGIAASVWAGVAYRNHRLLR